MSHFAAEPDAHPAAPPRSLDEHLEQVRGTYRRIEAPEAADAVLAGALLVDIRPLAQRLHEGAVPGAIPIERNVLEWRLAPTSPDRIAAVREDGRAVIVLCSQGYASSFAAASLRALGVDATDLIGGFHAWAGAGLPTTDLRHPERPALSAV